MVRCENCKKVKSETLVTMVGKQKKLVCTQCESTVTRIAIR